MKLLKTKLMCSVILLFLCGTVAAQVSLRNLTTPESAGCARTFFKEYTNSSHSAYPGQIFITKDGNILAHLQERKDPYVASDVSSLTLFDQAGNVIKSKLLDDGRHLFISKIVATANGNYVAAGNIYFSEDSSNLFVLEFDGNLDLLWQKVFRFDLPYAGVLDMIESSEGDLYLYLRDQPASLTEKRQVLKLDASGNTAWFQDYTAGANVFSGPTEITGKLAAAGDFIFLKYNEETYLVPHILKIRKDNGNIVWGREYRIDDILGPYSIEIFSFFSDKGSLYMNGRSNGTDVLFKIDTADGRLLRDVTHKQNGLYLDKMTYIGNGKIQALAGIENANVVGIVEMDTGFNVLRQQFLTISSPGDLVDLANLDDSVTYSLGLFYNSDPYLGTTSLAKFNFESSFASCQVTNPSLSFQPLNNQVVTVINTRYGLPWPEVVPFNLQPVAGTLAYNRLYCGNQPLCNSVTISGPASLCDSGTYHYSALKNPGCMAHVNWVVNASADSVEMLAISDTSVDLHITSPGNYHLEAKIFSSCQWVGNSMAITASVQAHQSLDLGPDTTICEGNHLTLNAGGGFSGYRWQDGSTDTSLTITQAGTYFVTVKAGCNMNLSDTVVVAPHAAIPFDLGADTSICNGGSMTLVAPAGFSNYKWTPGNLTMATAVVSPVSRTRYTVHADAEAGCSVSDSIFVDVKGVPVIQLGYDTSLCEGNYLTLDAGAGFDKYQWNTGESTRKVTTGKAGLYVVTGFLNGCSTQDSLQVLNVYAIPSFSLGGDTTLCNGQTLSYNYNLENAAYLWNTGATSGSLTIAKAGSYWLTVDQNGCSASDSLAVRYEAAPVVHLGNDTTICEGASLTLSGLNNNANYLWQDGSRASQFIVSSAGTFFVIASIGNCQSSDTIQVNQSPLPAFTLGPDQYICMGQTITLNPHINTGVTYLWQDGRKTPSYIVSAEGTYFLTVFNNCGSRTDSITITLGLCELIMPNAFTPNNDGLNDVFRVKYPFPVQSFLLRIYDRFGEMVFKSKDIHKGWDGTFKGTIALQGSYVWTITLVNGEGKHESSKGVVMLIK